MLLSLTTTHVPADDLGFLLHKHPQRVQTFALSFGTATVFYPEATPTRCTACLTLDVDPVGLVRGSGAFDQYVTDRPYAASSFLVVAIAQVFGPATQGRSKERPELAATPIPLEATIHALPVRGGEAFLRGVFEPLGYEVVATRLPLDETYPDWGDGPYHAVTVRAVTTLAALLTHLYVLIPVFDAAKHYYVGPDELEKLLAKGEGWLAGHPLRDAIVRRYLHRKPGLARAALDRLVGDEPEVEAAEEPAEREPTLNEQRHAAVVAALKATGAKRVLDLGCGEGKLLRSLAKDPQFAEVVGVDVSARALEIASRRLGSSRVTLLHGALTYRNARLAGYDAAAVVEVVEHFDPPRLAAFERVLFEFARPTCIVLTTPNREFNVRWPTLPAGELRHGDHRFEWARAEFRAWADGVAGRFGYAVEYRPVGIDDAEVGPPTQMAVFRR